MRTTLLAVLLLQLFLLVLSGFTGKRGASTSKGASTSQEASTSQGRNFKYGDIIAFQRGKRHYYHFGIYVPKGKFTDYGQKDEDDLFHFAGPLKGCKFGNLEKVSKNKPPERFNYLDSITNIKKVRKGTEEQITERILCKVFHCQDYDLLRNNCEHLATYIRYGVPVCLQLGQKGEGRCRQRKYGLTEDEKNKVIEMFRNEKLFGENETERKSYLEKYEEEMNAEEEIIVPDFN